MGSWILGSIALWDQIYPGWQVPKYFFISNVFGSSFAYYYQLVIRITLSLSQSNPFKRLPLYLIDMTTKQSNVCFTSMAVLTWWCSSLMVTLRSRVAVVGWWPSSSPIPPTAPWNSGSVLTFAKQQKRKGKKNTTLLVFRRWLIGSLYVEQCIILDSFKLKMEVLVDQCTR